MQYLLFLSNSSVYSSNGKVLYTTDNKVDHPGSLYASNKKSNELMDHAYSKLYNIPSKGLRLFAIDDPVGRPNMVCFGFTNKLREGKTVQIFNDDNCKYAFTYVDDIIESVTQIMQEAPDKLSGEDGLLLLPYW